MPQQVADRRDQDFVIWEQMNCEEILKHETYHEFNKKTCDMIITESRALAVKELLPLMAVGDEQGIKFENGTVKVPESFHRVYKLIQEGEWNNLGLPQEMGGFVLLRYHGKRHRVHHQFVRIARAKRKICQKAHSGRMGRHHASDRTRSRIRRRCAYDYSSQK